MTYKVRIQLIKFVFAIIKIVLWLLLYAAMASAIVGLNSDFGQFNMEFPLVVLTALPLYYGLKGKIKVPSFFSVLPFLLFYAFFDYFFWSMGRVFQWIDVGELTEVLDIFSISTSFFLFIGVLFLGLLLFKVFKRVSSLLLISSTLPIMIIVMWSQILPQKFVTTFKKISYKVQVVDQAGNVMDNGRLMLSIYLDSKRKNSQSRFLTNPGWLEQDIGQIQTALSQIEARNLHILVMESFLDPTLFPELNLPSDYLTPWMQELQNYRNLSLSPIYSGGTAQAEFEILCGVPAKSLVGTIEFNSFVGTPTSCLANWFNSVGYRTVAQNAYKPSFFNQVKGYKGIGFKDIHFPKNYVKLSDSHLEASFTKTSGKYMYDGDFFDQATQYYLNTRQEGQGGLNYMIGVYGHHDFHIDPDRFTQVVDLKDTKFEKIQNIVNQYYYRTRVIEKSVKAIVKDDPNAMILVVSDHLPRGPGGKNYYLSNGYPDIYTNVYYIWDRGVPIKVQEEINHYDLVWKLLALMMSGQCKDDKCLPELESDRYKQVMAHAMRLDGPDIGENINVAKH